MLGGNFTSTLSGIIINKSINETCDSARSSSEPGGLVKQGEKHGEKMLQQSTGGVRAVELTEAHTLKLPDKSRNCKD